VSRWAPGSPVPARDTGVEPDAHGALERHVAGPGELPVAPSRLRPRRFAVAPEVRAQYECEVEERTAIMVECGGVSEADARASAVEEFGCLEFYDFMLGRQCVPREQGIKVNNVNLDRTLLCSRCESVGHLVEACPFAFDDADVLRIAAARRARRRGRAA